MSQVTNQNFQDDGAIAQNSIQDSKNQGTQIQSEDNISKTQQSQIDNNQPQVEQQQQNDENANTIKQNEQGDNGDIKESQDENPPQQNQSQQQYIPQKSKYFKKENGNSILLKEDNDSGENEFQNISAVSRFEEEEEKQNDDEDDNKQNKNKIKSQREFKDEDFDDSEQEENNQNGDAISQGQNEKESMKKEIATLKAIIKEKDNQLSALQNEIDRLKKGNNRANVLPQAQPQTKDRGISYNEKQKSPLLQPLKVPKYESFWNVPEQNELSNQIQRQINKKASLDQMLGPSSLWVLQSEKTDQYRNDQIQQQPSYQQNYYQQNYQTPYNSQSKGYTQPIDWTINQNYSEFGAVNRQQSYSMSNSLNNNNNIFYSPQNNNKQNTPKVYQSYEDKNQQALSSRNYQPTNQNVYSLNYYQNSQAGSSQIPKGTPISNKKAINQTDSSNKNARTQTNNQKAQQQKLNYQNQGNNNNQKQLSGNLINNTKLAPITKKNQ